MDETVTYEYIQDHLSIPISGIAKQEIVTSGYQDIRFNTDKTITMIDHTAGNQGLIIDLENLSMNTNLNGSEVDYMTVKGLNVNRINFLTANNYIEVPDDNSAMTTWFKSMEKMRIDEDSTYSFNNNLYVQRNDANRINLDVEAEPELQMTYGGVVTRFSNSWFTNVGVQVLKVPTFESEIDANTSNIAGNTSDIVSLDSEIDTLISDVQELEVNQGFPYTNSSSVDARLIALESGGGGGTIDYTLRSYCGFPGDVYPFTNLLQYIESNDSRITSNDTDIATLTSDLNDLDTIVTSNTSRITTLEDNGGSSAVDTEARAAISSTWPPYSSTPLSTSVYYLDKCWEYNTSSSGAFGKAGLYEFQTDYSDNYVRISASSGYIIQRDTTRGQTTFYPNSFRFYQITDLLHPFEIADCHAYFTNVSTAILPGWTGADALSRIVALEGGTGEVIDANLRTYVGYDTALPFTTLVDYVSDNDSRLDTHLAWITQARIDIATIEPIATRADSLSQTNALDIATLTGRVSDEEARVPTLTEVNDAIDTWEFSSTNLTNVSGGNTVDFSASEIELSAGTLYNKMQLGQSVITNGTDTSTITSAQHQIATTSVASTLTPGELYMVTALTPNLERSYLTHDDLTFLDTSGTYSVYGKTVEIADPSSTHTAYVRPANIATIHSTERFASLFTAAALTSFNIKFDTNKEIYGQADSASTILNVVNDRGTATITVGDITTNYSQLKDSCSYGAGGSVILQQDLNHGFEMRCDNTKNLQFANYYYGTYYNKGYISYVGSNGQLNFTGAHTCTVEDQDITPYELGQCVYATGEICNTKSDDTGDLWDALPVIKPDGSPKEFYGFYLEYIEGSKIEYKQGTFTTSVEKDDERLWIGAHGNCYASVWSGTYNVGDILIPHGKYLEKLTEDKFNEYSNYEFAHLPKIRCVQSVTVADGEKLAIEL